MPRESLPKGHDFYDERGRFENELDSSSRLLELGLVRANFRLSLAASSYRIAPPPSPFHPISCDLSFLFPIFIPFLFASPCHFPSLSAGSRVLTTFSATYRYESGHRPRIIFERRVSELFEGPSKIFQDSRRSRQVLRTRGELEVRCEKENSLREKHYADLPVSRKFLFYDLRYLSRIVPSTSLYITRKRGIFTHLFTSRIETLFASRCELPSGNLPI